MAAERCGVLTSLTVNKLAAKTSLTWPRVRAPLVMSLAMQPYDHGLSLYSSSLGIVVSLVPGGGWWQRPVCRGGGLLDQLCQLRLEEIM